MKWTIFVFNKLLNIGHKLAPFYTRPSLGIFDTHASFKFFNAHFPGHFSYAFHYSDRH